MTDAPVAREHLIAAHNLILKLQENPRTSLEQVDGKDLLAQAIADAEARGASRSAPPADEVAGPQAHLERGARIAFNHLDYRTANRRPLSGGEAAWLEAERARIENHMKGKR